ncbi:MAG: hypothetical protein S4CHLAM102_15000 [Chlamydiia bacterium]|nr:hypothetical protein [Chlamydiia bacterium]
MPKPAQFLKIFEELCRFGQETSALRLGYRDSLRSKPGASCRKLEAPPRKLGAGPLGPSSRLRIGGGLWDVAKLSTLLRKIRGGHHAPQSKKGPPCFARRAGPGMGWSGGIKKATGRERVAFCVEHDVHARGPGPRRGSGP